MTLVLAFLKIYICIYIYIFSIAVWPAVSAFVPLSVANRQYTGWLKDSVLKPVRKLSLVETFVPSESARSDQEAIYSGASLVM